MLDTGTNLGLVRHMAGVESWFHVFDGEPTGQFPCEDGGIGGGAGTG